MLWHTSRMHDDQHSADRKAAGGDEDRHHTAGDDAGKPQGDDASPPAEIGGRPGPDPTRYGDWEKNGRCIDF